MFGGKIGLPELAVLIFVVLLVSVPVAMWRIFRKTGDSGWLVLLFVFGPFGLFIAFLILAFGDWPILREINALRKSGSQTAEMPS